MARRPLPGATVESDYQIQVEDAAEAHLATYKGRPVGGLAPVATFSFYGNKTFTCGEGGATRAIECSPDELVPHLARHKDVNAIVHCLAPGALRTALEKEAAINIKRVVARHGASWPSASEEHPYAITDTMEVKTTWHPVGL